MQSMGLGFLPILLQVTIRIISNYEHIKYLYFLIDLVIYKN